MGFKYNLEEIIDDWVLMGMLVGNDFIPHLPKLHINGNALSFLYECYMEVLPKLDGYLNEGGIVNLKRFQIYLDNVSKFDRSNFEENYTDYKWLESKKTQKPQKETSAEAIREEKELQMIKDLAKQQGTLCDDESNDEQDLFEKEFQHSKNGYYEDKFKVRATAQQIGEIAYEYMLGIQWICHYYYNGVQSWGWFYPYHYSPFVSDLNGISEMKLKYKMGRPFLPFQQLLAVLPNGSKDCIPEELWNLMDEKTSPIGDFYPTMFETDLNGKQQEWEALVLIPFIEKDRLLEAMAPCIAKLSEVDEKRNVHTCCKLFTHDPDFPHTVPSSLPGCFADT